MRVVIISKICRHFLFDLLPLILHIGAEDTTHSTSTTQPESHASHITATNIVFLVMLACLVPNFLYFGCKNGMNCLGKILEYFNCFRDTPDRRPTERGNNNTINEASLLIRSRQSMYNSFRNANGEPPVSPGSNNSNEDVLLIYSDGNLSSEPPPGYEI